MRSQKDERSKKRTAPHSRVELFPGRPPETPTETFITGLCYHDLTENDRVSLKLWLYTDDAERGLIKLRSSILEDVTVTCELFFAIDPVTGLRTLTDYHYGPFPVPLPPEAFLMLREYGIAVSPGAFIGDTKGP